MIEPYSFLIKMAFLKHMVLARKRITNYCGGNCVCQHSFVVLLPFIFIFISSCTRIHISNDQAIDAARTHLIHHNTTYADVLGALGPPAKVTALPSGFAFLYESTQVLQRGIALSVYFLRVSVTKGDRVLDSYVVVFDERGLVVGHEKLTKSVPLSRTFAVTIPTGGPPQELTALAPQHHWGMSLLNPLPHTLNAASDIDVGMHGLEQRGTPRAVGQRTLAGP
jgi:hypothetical protein